MQNGPIGTGRRRGGNLIHLHSIIRRLPLLAIAAALALAVMLPASASAGGNHGNDQSRAHGHQGKGHDNGRHRGSEVGVMTRNLYLGADLNPAIAATTPDELAAADGLILREVVANDFPTRAKGLANEILRTEPGPGRAAGGRALAEHSALHRRRPRSTTTTSNCSSTSSTRARGPRTGSSRSRPSSISKPRPT